MTRTINRSPFVLVAAIAIIAAVRPRDRVIAQDQPSTEFSALVPVWGLSFSPDSESLAAVGGDRAARGVVRVWDTSNWSPRFTLGCEHAATAVAFSPDGSRLLVSTQSGEVLVVDAAKGDVDRRWDSEQGAVNGVAWTPDGERLLTAGADGTIKIWNADNGELRQTLDAAAADQQAGLAANPQNAEAQPRLRDLWDLAVSPDGQSLVSGGWGDTTRLWNLSTGQLLQNYAATDQAVQGVAFTPDGRHFVSNSMRYGIVYVRETDSGLERAAIRAGGRDVAVHPGGELLASCAWQEIRVFRLNLALPTDDDVARYQQIIARFEDDDPSVRDAASEEVRRIGLPIEPLLFDAIRAPGAETRIRARRLWNEVRSPNPVATLSGHLGEPRQVTISPDGRLFVTASKGGDVRIWDTAAFELQRELTLTLK